MEITYQTVGMPRIGDKAPEFKAITTQGEINFPADYKGKWVILYAGMHIRVYDLCQKGR